MLVAALDIGSSVVKAAIFDGLGTVRGYGSARTRVTNGVEMDGTDLTERPLAVLADAVRQSSVRADEIHAVAVTGSRGTVLALDEADRPLGRAAMWTDARGGAALGRFVARSGGRARFILRTGLFPDTTLSVAAIGRWRENGDQAGDAARFVGPQAAALERMTGQATTDITHAAHYGLFALDADDWDEVLCAAAELRRGQLPRLVPPGSVVGGLSDEAARLTGLRAGTPVLAAGSDAVCYKLGAGVTAPGEATVSVGTAATFATIAGAPYADPTGVLSCTAAIRAGLWEVFGIQPSGAAMLEWLRDLLGGTENDALAGLIREARTVAPGADGLTAVPYLVGAGVPHQRGAAAMFSGLRPRHGRAHFARAVLEGVGFSLRDTADALAAAGHQPILLRMVGGAARSEVWTQTVADALATPIETVRAEEPGLLGAAMMGAIAAGLHPDIAAAVRAMTAVRRRVEPEPASAEALAQAHARYRRAADAARSLAADTDEEET